MNAFIQYAIVALSAVGAAIFFYRVIIPVSQTDFILKKSTLSTEQLLFGIGELAHSSKQYALRGAGLSVRLIKKRLSTTFFRVQKAIQSGKEEPFTFEYWIYENYRTLSEILLKIKRYSYKFSFLPHAHKTPRVYDFAAYLIKSYGGFLNREIILRSIEAYNRETLFFHTEIMALKTAFEYCLLEYLSAFCAQSEAIARMTHKAAQDAEKTCVDLSAFADDAYLCALYRKSGEKAQRNMARFCMQNTTDIHTRTHNFFSLIASYDGFVETAVKTLFSLPHILSAENAVGLSAAAQLMSDEAWNDYSILTIQEKHACLLAVQKKAVKEKISEPALLRRVIESARNNHRGVLSELVPKLKLKQPKIDWFLKSYNYRIGCLPAIPAIAVPPPIVCQQRNSIPSVNLLSCGRYALITDSTGQGSAIYESRPAMHRADITLQAFGKTYKLLSGKFTASFDCTVYEQDFKRFTSQTKISVLPSGNGELRTVRITNCSKQKLKFNLNSAVAVFEKSAVGALIEEKRDPLSQILTVWRSSEETPLFLSHYADSHFETKYTVKNAAVLSCTTAALAVGESAEFVYFTLCSYNQDALCQEIKETKSIGFLDVNAAFSRAVMRGNALPPYVNETAAKLLFASSGSVKDTEFAVRFPCTRPSLSLKLSCLQRIADFKRELSLLKELYRYGVGFNLFILYTEQARNFCNVSETIETVLGDIDYRRTLNADSAIFMINEQDAPSDARLILQNCVQMSRLKSIPIASRKIKNSAVLPSVGLALPKIERTLDSGGGFTSDYAYAAEITSIPLPRPSLNIIANSQIGCSVLQNGVTETFYTNPCKQHISKTELIMLSEAGRVWSVSGEPCGKGGRFTAVQGLGYSEFSNDYNGFISTHKIYISPDSAIKYHDLTIENHSDAVRLICAAFAVDAALHENELCAISAELKQDAVCIQNRINGLEAYISCSEKPQKFSMYKEAFTDINHNIVPIKPATKGCQFHPAVSVALKINPAEKKRIIFALANKPISDFSACDNLIASKLSTIQIHGYSDAAILSRHLPYQALASYHCEQSDIHSRLQSCLGLLYIDSFLVRKQIMEYAEQTTQSSLWLPVAAAEYIRFTGDFSVLSRTEPLVTACIRTIRNYLRFGDNELCLTELGNSLSISTLLYYAILSFQPYLQNLAIRAEFAGYAARIKIAVNAALNSQGALGALSDSLLAQSLAVISGASRTDAAQSVLNAAYQNFSKPVSPQQAQTAAWFAMALFTAGQAEKAWNILQTSCGVFMGTAYFSEASALFYKCLTEKFLGVKIVGNKLSITPSLPPSISEISFDLHTADFNFDITVFNSASKGDWQLKTGNIFRNAIGVELTKSLCENKLIVLRSDTKK